MTAAVTAREVHLAIKKGTTSEELAEKYGVTVDELFTSIKERMTSGGKELIRDLQKNDKKRRKKEESAQETHESESATEVTSITTDGEEEEAINNEETKVTRNGSNLAKLKESESELSEELIALEKKHEEMALQRRQILNNAKATNQIIIEEQNKLLELEKVVEELIVKYDDLAREMTANTADRRSYEELLEEVREKIEVLSKVTAILNIDGTIECSEPEFLEMLTAEEESAELEMLMAMPEAEDFTLRQLKGIVKAKLLGQLGVSVTFNLQQAYNLI